MNKADSCQSGTRTFIQVDCEHTNIQCEALFILQTCVTSLQPSNTIMSNNLLLPSNRFSSQLVLRIINICQFMIDFINSLNVWWVKLFSEAIMYKISNFNPSMFPCIVTKHCLLQDSNRVKVQVTCKHVNNFTWSKTNYHTVLSCDSTLLFIYKCLHVQDISIL